MMKKLRFCGLALALSGILAPASFLAEGAGINPSYVILPSSRWTPEAHWEALTYVVTPQPGNNPIGKPFGVPNDDANGNPWYSVEYSPTNSDVIEWETHSAPFHTDNNYLGQPSYQWIGNNQPGDIYFRRTFSLTEIPQSQIYLAAGHDDSPCEVYINGELVFSSHEGWNEDEYVLLSDSQKGLLKTGENIIAVHVSQDTGGAFADCGLYGYSEFEFEGLNYSVLSVEDKTCEVALNHNASGEVIIPEKAIDPENEIEYTVVSITESAFSDCTNLTNVIFPNSLTQINDYAFNGCANLASLKLTENIKSIGEFAFAGCGKLVDLTIGESVRTIGQYAFAECGLKYVRIPASIKSTGKYAFWNCMKLADIEISSLENWCNISFGGSWSNPITHALYLDGEIITDLVIPESITSIKPEAFGRCHSLTSVTFPNSMTIIESGTFNSCENLSNVKFGNAVENIGYDAFYGCGNLKEIILPPSVKEIGDNAFNRCGISVISIPESVNFLGDGAFGACRGLLEVICNALTPPAVQGNPFKESYQNALTLHIQKGTKDLYENAECWKDFGSILEDIDSDDSYLKTYKKIDGITYIFNTSLQEVIVKNADSDIEIADILPSVEFNGIEYPVRTIGVSAFDNCQKLTKVIIPGTIYSIDGFAFANCRKLVDLTIGESVRTIGQYAFAECGLKYVRIPASIKSIGEFAFWNCMKLADIEISSLENWCNISFGGAWSNPITHALYLDGEIITDLVIPESITSIKPDAFGRCRSLTSVTFPNSMTIIESGTFNSCENLSEIVLPNSMETISQNAFADCSQIKNIYCKAIVPPEAFGNSFGNSDVMNITLHIPRNTKEFYSDANGWNNFGSIIDDISEGIEENENYIVIGPIKYSIDFDTNEVFVHSSDNSIKRAYINSVVNINGTDYGVTSIGEEAFSGCADLSIVKIPKSIVSIKEKAFAGCSSLISIDIPDSVTYLGDNAFVNCTGINTVIFPSSITHVGNYAFYNCTNLSKFEISDLDSWCKAYFGAYWSTPCYYDLYLNGELITDLTIPENITELRQNVFGRCSSIINVSIPSSVTIIGDSAFHGCPNIENIEMGNSVTSIGVASFSDCIKLEILNIPSSVVNIKLAAFRNCTGLKTVNCFAPTPPDLDSNGFSGTSTELITLHVPEGSKELYENAIGWKDFGKIIDGFNPDDDGDKITTEIYLRSEINNWLDDGFSSEWEFVFDEEIGMYVFDCSGEHLIPAGAEFKFGDQNWHDVNYGGDFLIVPKANRQISLIYNGPNMSLSRDFNGTIFLRILEEKEAYAIFQPTDEDIIIEFEGIKYEAIDSEKLTATVIGTADNNQNPSSVIIKEFVEIDDKIFTVVGINDNAFENIATLSSVIMPNSIEIVGEKAFMGTGLSQLNLPSALIKIGNQAFSNCDMITNLNLPESLTTIGNGAFQGTGISEITIPASVKEISDMAFADCVSLTSVNFYAQRLTLYYSSVFSNSPVASLKINTINVPASMFWNSSTLTDVEFGENVSSIGNGAFQGTGISEITIPASVKEIGDMAFAECESLSAVDFYAGSLSSYSSNVFYNSPIASLRINISKIHESMFKDCSTLTNVEFGDEVVSIGNYAFEGCTALETVEWGANMYDIGNYAFNGCTNLSSIVSMAYEPPYAQMYTFPAAAYGKATVTVPEQSLKKYARTDPWSRFLNYLTVAGEVTLSHYEVEMAADEVFQLGVFGTESEVAWSTTNPDVAYVNKYGLIMAMGQTGIATVSAEVDGETISCKVIVSALQRAGKAPARISSSTDIEDIEPTEIVIESISTDPTFLNVRLYPVGACTVLRWSSSDENIATIDRGFVSIIDNGIVTFTVETENGLSDSYTLDTNTLRIGNVSAEESEETLVDVYDLAGRRILSDASRKQISRLNRGVYIVGGQKVFVK